MHVVIFEGSKWHTFAPLSLSRPVFALASGAGTLLEKQVRHLRPTRLTLWVRDAMADYCRRELVPRLKVPCAVNEPLDEPCVILDDDTLVRKAVVNMPGLSHIDALNRTDNWKKLLDLPRMDE